AFALDRDALVDRVYGAIGVTEPTQSFVTPVAGDWGSDEFSQYTPDADRVAELMEGDGWELNSAGVWERDGETASMTLHTLAGNARRDLMVQVIQSQLGEAGFDIEIVTKSPAELFGQIVLPGEYELGLWTLVDTFPTLNTPQTFSTETIPAEENGFAGLNFARASDPALDELLSTVSMSVDEDERYEASMAAEAIVAEQALSLPIATVPNVLLWSDELGGDIAINPSEGPWWNLEAWGRVDG
ncbi:MAG: ABC transporter substrate-binding protein, partial [Pseudoclavibacter sp.]